MQKHAYNIHENAPGLYIHIPFCKSRCFYCRFTNSLKNTPSEHNNFLNMLEAEAAFEKKQHKNTEFKTLYLGGGTPSSMSVEELKRLFSIISQNFNIAQNAERTIETNPDDITPQKAELLAQSGINRASIGFQTFNNDLLKKIGRKHTAQTSKTAFELLKKAGITNISVDLIISLPDQTPEIVANDLQQICELNPEQVTVYELTIEPKTVFALQAEQKKLRLPCEQTQLEMLKLVQQKLSGRNYNNYELLSWAKPGFESRHNTNYWLNGTYLGLGPGAYSYLNGNRYTKADSYQTYMQKCGTLDFSPQHTETLSPIHKQHETLQLGLRLDQGVCVDDFSIIENELKTQIKQLLTHGLLQKSADRLKLTPKGKLLAESVFEMLCP